MKNMEIMRATKSTLPSATTTIASADVISVALRGSLLAPVPAARNEFAFTEGKQRSRASAWSVRGAINTQPIALDRVAQPSPIGMIGPQIAIRDMIS